MPADMDTLNMQALIKATENTDTEELFRRGEEYCSHESYSSAVNMYRAAAWRHHALAQARLGDAYLNGKGVAKNYASAFKWYLQSARQGCPYGCMRLAYCYRNSIGCERDYDKSFRLDMYAAAHGIGDAQEAVGDCYFYGIRGQKKNPGFAFRRYRKAVDSGAKGALCNLGCCYEFGTGTEVNVQEAFSCFAEGARLGDPVCATNAGNHYYYGDCTKKDSARR
ncbi:MAG: sel1 repeat family protein [Clostridia bacterium]|nr:sel1 repeat family protein [Clostridia bacterium]